MERPSTRIKSVYFQRWNVQSCEERDVASAAASLIQTVLFEGQVVLTDSTIINDILLRRALIRYPVLKGLFKHELVVPALRDNGSGPVPLTKTAESIAKQKGMAPVFTEGEFEDFRSLEAVEREAKPQTFSIADASDYNTDQLLDIFRNAPLHLDTGEHLPDEVRSIVVGEAERVVAEGGKLGAAMFARKETMGAVLERELRDPTIWGKWGLLLDFVANTPAMTFWPDVVGAMPVYHPEHTRSIELWRQRKESTQVLETVSTEMESRFDLASYVEGLVSLTIDDVLALRESTPCKHWAEFLNSTHHKFDISSLRDQLDSYRFLIGDRITERLGFSRTPDCHKLELSLSRLGKKGLKEAVSGLSIGVVEHMSKVPFSLVRNTYQQLLDKDPAVLRARELNQSMAKSSGTQTTAAVWLDRKAEGGGDRVGFDSQLDGIGSRDTLIGYSRQR